MKIGCCIDPALWGGDMLAYLKQLKEIGYDFIELPIIKMIQMGEGELENVCKNLQSSPIGCECCNVLFPADVRITGDEVDYQSIGTYVDKALGVAARLGARIVVFGSAAAKNIPEGFAYEKAALQYFLVLDIFYVCGLKYYIIIAVEHLNKNEANFVTTIKEAYDFVKEVNLSNIKILVDYFHMKMENEDEEILLELKDDLVHVHIAENITRAYPVEASREQYKSFSSKLKAIGYCGRVSIEATSQDILADATNSLPLIRDIF